MEVVNQDNIRMLPDSIRTKRVCDLTIGELKTVISCGISNWQAEYVYKGYISMVNNITKKITENHCT